MDIDPHDLTLNLRQARHRKLCRSRQNGTMSRNRDNFRKQISIYCNFARDITRCDSYSEISQDIIVIIFQEIKAKSLAKNFRANSEEEQMLLKSSAPEM